MLQPELPVVQAGMGGGVARHELAAAVSEAGGLGTIGMRDPGGLRRELAAARERTSRPVAVNLLLPFARAAHFQAASEADVVVTFWGRPRRRTAKAWVHQAGSLEEALQARAAGADAVIVQGVEAGGHVRGTTPALELLARVRASVGSDYPLWLAGGIADGADVQAALDAGADAAVAGTRFLMSDESHAHPEYKARVAATKETVLTELFGTGWPASHRVVPNAATERWLPIPRWLRAAHRLSRLPAAPDGLIARMSRLPLLLPTPPTDDGPPGLLDAGPLYAGETALRIDDVRPAAELVRELSGTPRSP